MWMIPLRVGTLLFYRYLLTSVGLNLKIYERVIEADDGPLKVSLASMVDLDAY